MRERLLKLLLNWFKSENSMAYDNYVSGTSNLCLDGYWDFNELVDFLIEHGVSFNEKDIS